MALKDIEVKEQWVTVSTKSDYVELLKSGLVQQHSPFEQTKTVLEERLAKAEAQPDAALMEVITQRDRLHDAMNR